MCWLSLVVTSTPARRSLSWIQSTVDWCMAPSKWGFNLKSNSTDYPDHGHHGDPSPTRKIHVVEPGIETLELVISSQKFWPLDHEAGHAWYWGSFLAEFHQVLMFNWSNAFWKPFPFPLLCLQESNKANTDIFLVQFWPCIVVNMWK